MSRSDRALRVKRRLQGVAFLAVVAALLGFTVAVYNKSLPWQSSAKVTLDADRIGNQLVVPADVKLNGILVGRVSGVSVSGDHARMTLQIDKSKLSEIPADVEARILPKTLFGEKFVELVRPPGTSPTVQQHLRAGDVIQQDHSKTAIELQTVFSHLVPLLRTLQPAELSVTLSNLASALRGRGDALGHNLELVNTYFSRFNPDMPNFQHDISALADMASNYADAAPDLLATLRNFSANARTFTAKQDVYAQFLTGSQDFAETATRVFGNNADRLIKLADVSQPVADLYAKYSIVLECLPNGLAIYDRTRLEQTFGQGPYLHITLTPVGDRGPYGPNDRPKKSDITSMVLPPNCYGLPYGSHGLHPVMERYPGQHPSDNYQCGGYAGQQGPSCTVPQSSGATPAGGASTKKSSTSALSGLGGLGGINPAGYSLDRRGDVGSPAEQQFVAGLMAPFTGVESTAGASLTDLLIGPMLRGMAVTLA
ncbi:MAG TPA: MCE family protein [Mycobacteriales bacterium]|nr:MCE family protein [Mycobacteriales bacterium]